MLFVLAGCTVVGPEFEAPETQAPADWSSPLLEGLESEAAQLSEWWKVFDDPLLEELIQQAKENNNGLEIAALRTLEAQAQLGVATGLQYPQGQFATGEATWISPPKSTSVNNSYWRYGLAGVASWEIDFWGRFKRGIESADAAYLGSLAAFDKATVLLTATVADTYIIIRTLQRRLEIANENVALQQRSFEITEVQFRNGADSELDMQQANTLLLATQATVPVLQTSLKQSLNALATLLGLPPGTLDQKLISSSGIPALPERVNVGYPADMLRLRPDVREAEMLAMAQNALVGLAEADLYPSFTLTGSIGLSAGGPGSSSFGDLFSGDALSVSIGPSFVWPFLNYGRIKNNIRVQDARLQQALIAYRETALQAAREAEDAIVAYTGAQQQARILEKTVQSAVRSNEISTLRYQEGFSDYQRVLDAQQALFTQQQRLVDARGSSVRSLVSLYKALGGGWQSRAGAPAPGSQTRQQMEARTDWGDLIPSVSETPQQD